MELTLITGYAAGGRFREMKQGAAATLHPAPFAVRSLGPQSRPCSLSAHSAPSYRTGEVGPLHVCLCWLLAVIALLFGLPESWHGRSLRQGKTLRVPPCLRACGRAANQTARTGHFYSIPPNPMLYHVKLQYGFMVEAMSREDAFQKARVTGLIGVRGASRWREEGQERRAQDAVDGPIGPSFCSPGCGTANPHPRPD